MKMLTEREVANLVANTAAINTEQQLRAAAQALVDRAHALAFVLTVEQRALTPLAMGHYETVVSVREARR